MYNKYVNKTIITIYERSTLYMKYYELEEVANLFKVTENTVKNWIRLGKMEANETYLEKQKNEKGRRSIKYTVSFPQLREFYNKNKRKYRMSMECVKEYTIMELAYDLTFMDSENNNKQVRKLNVQTTRNQYIKDRHVLQKEYDTVKERLDKLDDQINSMNISIAVLETWLEYFSEDNKEE